MLSPINKTLGIGSLLIIVLFYVPIGELPFGPSITLWALLSGMLAGGRWPAARVLLAVAFILPWITLSLVIIKALRQKYAGFSRNNGGE